VSNAAILHGKMRHQQGYTVAMLVEESRILTSKDCVEIKWSASATLPASVTENWLPLKTADKVTRTDSSSSTNRILGLSELLLWFIKVQFPRLR
jgi:hypothetical protein